MKSLKFLGPLFFLLLPFGMLAQSDLVGTWTAQLPNGEGGTMGIKVTMTANDTYSVDLGMDGSIDIKGSYTVSGNKVTIQDDPGSDCTGKGVYTFSIVGKQLTMTKESDACQGRGGPEGKMVMTKM